MPTRRPGRSPRSTPASTPSTSPSSGCALGQITSDNAQGEEYLTDVIGVFVAAGKVVASVPAPDAVETLGVNDRVQLAAARRAMRDRIVEHWMREGVTIIDPQTTWMGVRVTIEPDVTIHQNTQLHGATHIARMASVGPDCDLAQHHGGRGRHGAQVALHRR